MLKYNVGDKVTVTFPSEPECEGADTTVSAQVTVARASRKEYQYSVEWDGSLGRKLVRIVDETWLSPGKKSKGKS